jgi:putative ABC transport system ATP-binding protein
MGTATQSPLMLVSGLAKTYAAATPVEALRDVNLAVDEGEFVSIEGVSGSGKSTLMNILALLDRPSRGSYKFAGREVGDLAERDRAALRCYSFGFVFQAFHLLSTRSAVENVELGLLHRGGSWKTRRRLAIDAIEQVGLGDRRDAFPETLSGGERQRVAIARALVGEPQVLLCDEPTGNLDRGNTESILALLKAINDRGLTLIVVTHDAAVANLTSRHLVVDEGVVGTR